MPHDPETDCPNCGEYCAAIAPFIRWCSRCGTILHWNGRAWFREGPHSTPTLVRFIRESRGDCLDTIREYAGLVCVPETSEGE